MTHYLSSYSKFNSKEEAARQHSDTHLNAMNKTDRAVLEMIRCYSVKYLAAHLKHETIEKKLSKRITQHAALFISWKNS